MSGGSNRHSDRIRSTVGYYRSVAPHIERELTGRPDRGFWTRIAEEHSGARVLEVGCGTGRVTGCLAPRVRRLAALDLSPDMLRRARRRFSPGDPVDLVRADILRLPLAGRAFDLALAANGVFSHLLRAEERLRALREIRRRLRPGGTVIVDTFWLSRERRSECTPPEGDRRSRTLAGDAGPLRVEERWLSEPETARCRVTYRYRHPDGSTERAESTLRFWTGPEVRRIFPEAGLEITATWGDYERGGWSPHTKRLVVRARRPD